MNAFLLYIPTIFLFTTAYGWYWQCSTNEYCTRVQSSLASSYPTLEVCKLLCGGNDYLNIWPYPTGNVTSEKSIILTNPENIQFVLKGTSGTKTFLEKVVEYFHTTLNTDQTSTCQDSYDVIISLEALSDDISLTLDTDEYYSLKIGVSDGQLKVDITGNTVFGVRHGVETLLQLLVPYEKDHALCLATLKNIQLDDKPVYRHRGLLLDSARNYLSVDIIKKNIDAMAASKLNVLHWHITDSQSFPLEIPSLPNMTKYGAYSEKSIYTSADIQDLVKYAEVRGVRILLEIDGPSHAGSGWQWGPEAGLGNLAVCINQQPWRSFCIQPPCGQLNPANPNLYKVLQQLYGDIMQMIPNTGVFHMGGDEIYSIVSETIRHVRLLREWMNVPSPNVYIRVFIPCWNSTNEILNYIKPKPQTEETFLDLWGEFQNKSVTAYDTAIGNDKTKIVVWTSHLTEPDVIQKYLPKERYIIQTWVPDSSQDLITSLINLGYKIIISTKDKWYLDHGFWGSTTYYNWRNVYNNKMYSQYHPSVLGGEVCMWGELVDDSNVESRVWPRAAAAAERLWSNPKSTAGAAEGRFFSHRERLVKRGLKTEAEIPQWCVQNEGECSSYL